MRPGHLGAVPILYLLLEMVMVTMGVREANGPNYLALRAVDKLNLLWANCIEDINSSRWYSFMQMAELFVEPMCPVFRCFHHRLPPKDENFSGKEWIGSNI